MKIALKVLLVLLVLNNTAGQFQSSTVVKSNKIVRYQGINYYLHTVEQGNTLYSICKAYGVTQELIAESNPNSVLSPLSVGQVIRIPVAENTLPVQSSDETQPEGEFLLHTVSSGDNVYSLSRRYQVTEDIIYKYNPTSRNSIREGEIIRIPKSNGKDVPGNAEQSPEPKDTKYRVKPGDTLYRISKDFNVSIRDLISSNPQLRWGLKADQEIIIPGKPSVYWLDLLADSDSIFTVKSYRTLSVYQCDSLERNAVSGVPVKMVVMLPFFSKETSATGLEPLDDSISVEAKSKKQRLRGRVAAEFYEGILLSIDTLRKAGQNISLFVYDTYADTNRVKEIIQELDIVEPDVIIGPLYPKNISLVSKFSFERKIPFVPPLATNNMYFDENPFSFRVIPSPDIEKKKSSEFLSGFTDRNIILVYKNNIKYLDEVNAYKRMLMEQLAAGSALDTVELMEVIINDDLHIELDSALHDEKENLVFVISGYEPDVINVISRLHFLKREHKIEVFGLPAWQKFDNVRIDVLHELGVTVFTPFYIQYKNSNVINFVEKCRTVLGYEPYLTTSRGSGINYTFLGYDLGVFFIEALQRYGDNSCECAEHLNVDLLLSDYNYKRNTDNGYNENTSIRFIKYNSEYVVEEIGIP